MRRLVLLSVGYLALAACIEPAPTPFGVAAGVQTVLLGRFEDPTFRLSSYSLTGPASFVPLTLTDGEPIAALLYDEPIDGLQLGRVEHSFVSGPCEPDTKALLRPMPDHAVRFEGSYDAASDTLLQGTFEQVDQLAAQFLPSIDLESCTRAGGCYNAKIDRCELECVIGEPVLPTPPAPPVPPSECEAGGAGCVDEPFAARLACGPYQAHRLGQRECTPVGAPCPADPDAWPAGLPTDAVYVKAGASGTGGRDDPLGNLSDALARAANGGTIALLGGVPVAAINRPVTIVGVCPRLSRLLGTSTVTADLSLRDLSIEAVDTGLSAYNGALRLQGVWVHAGRGDLWGVILTRATALLDDVVIDGFNYGLFAQQTSSVAANRLQVTGFQSGGVMVLGNSFVRGDAWVVSGSARASEHSAAIALARANGLLSRVLCVDTVLRCLNIDYSQATVQDLVSRGLPESGTGIFVVTSTLTLERARFLEHGFGGMYGAEGCDLTLRDLEVRGARQVRGSALSFQKRNRVRLERALVIQAVENHAFEDGQRDGEQPNVLEISDLDVMLADVQANPLPAIRLRDGLSKLNRVRVRAGGTNGLQIKDTPPLVEINDFEYQGTGTALELGSKGDVQMLRVRLSDAAIGMQVAAGTITLGDVTALHVGTGLSTYPGLLETDLVDAPFNLDLHGFRIEAETAAIATEGRSEMVEIRLADGHIRAGKKLFEASDVCFNVAQRFERVRVEREP